MEGVSAGLGSVAKAIRYMAATIPHGEAGLEDGLSQRERLLREAYNRFKNTLQLIDLTTNLRR